MVEIVGVAGAGKSTLSRCHLPTDRACRLGPFLDVGRLAHAPYVLHSLLGLIPLVIAGLRRQPRMSWREIKLVIYVSEWPRYLSRNYRRSQRMFVLDQGPIYTLGRLEAWASRASDRPYIGGGSSE